jgi:hypothetical protein
MLDIQAFFVQEGLSLRNLPAEKLVTETYVEHANRTLGPFVLTNAGSTLAGCPLRQDSSALETRPRAHCVRSEGACPTVPSPLVGEGQGGGWPRSTEHDARSRLENDG